MLDRPISEPDAAGDAIRWPVVAPDREVRGFQSVLLDLGARLGLPGMVDEGGAPKYRDYADYMVNHQRRCDERSAMAAHARLREAITQSGPWLGHSSRLHQARKPSGSRCTPRTCCGSAARTLLMSSP